jgi:hypothetical protein
MSFKTTLNAKVVFICSKNGVHFKTVKMVSYGSAYDRTQSIKEAIQRFLDGNTENTVEIEGVQNESDEADKVHDVCVLLQEPYKSLFEELFDVKSWQMPKEDFLPL